MLAVFASHESRAISSFEIAKTQANFLYFCNLKSINFSLTEKMFLFSSKFLFKQCYCNKIVIVITLKVGQQNPIESIQNTSHKQKGTYI